MRNLILLHDPSHNHETPEACNLHIIKVGFKEIKHKVRQNNAQLTASLHVYRSNRLLLV